MTGERSARTGLGGWPAAVLLWALLLCVMGVFPDARAASSYRATIAWTRYGVPHVTAADWGSLGYGYGYALAEDDLCVLAEAVVTFRGQRSRYFGADGAVPGDSTLGNPNNLDSDFFFRDVLSDQQIAAFRAAQPEEIDSLVAGFAAGFSRYALEIRSGERPGRHSACRHAEWLGEITAADVYRRMEALALAAGSIEHIAAIAAPWPAVIPPGAGLAPADAGGGLAAARPGAGLGSNMIGLGRQATGEAQGLLLGNPHWYWDSVDRFHQLQLTIPGKLDVEGATIVGVPLVLIGFNRDVAWSHTYSTAARFTLYRLKLAPGEPLAYLYDGQVRRLIPKTLSVEVKGSDGRMTVVTRTLYDSQYGPVLASSFTADHVYALRDVNLRNFRMYRTWLRFSRASSLGELMRIQQEEVSFPWVNTIAVGRNDERVWYADVGAVPDVSDGKAAACAAAPYEGIPALDGSRALCEWDDDGRSPQPGTLPAASLPQLVRTDYAANMNDSYWLTNEHAPLEGYPRILGSAATAQSLRTRLGHLMVRQRLGGTDGLEGHLFNSENLRTLSLNSRNLAAELFLDDVLARICPLQHIDLPGSPTVDIREVCTVLSRWDRTGNTDSVGAHIWEQFVGRLPQVPRARLYTVPFNPAAPLDTPRGLAVQDALVVQAFAAGARAAQISGIPLNAPRSDYQYVEGSHGEHIPLAGGCNGYGYFTVICVQRRSDGSHAVLEGNSYMQVVHFRSDGVEPYTLLASAQSTDPASPHYRDYTLAYSRKEWQRAAFTRSEVKATTIRELELRSGRVR